MKKKTGPIVGLLRLWDFFHSVGGRIPIVPVVFSLLAASFEGLSTILLIPLATGLINLNFAFIREYHIFKLMPPTLSRILCSSNSMIFFMFTALIFICALLKNVFQYLSTIDITHQIYKIIHNIRVSIFNRYLSFGKLFFDRNNIGNLNTVMMTYTYNIALGVKELNSVLNTIFMIIIYMLLMFKISWKLTIFVLALSPIFYHAIRWLVEKIKQTSKKHVDTQNIISKKIYNILSGIPLVKAYTKEDDEKIEFASISKKKMELEYSISKKLELIRPIQEVIIISVILLLVSAVAFIALGERKMLASFLVYFYIIKRTLTYFNTVSNFKVILAQIEAPLDEILKVFDNEGKFFISEGKKEFKGLRDKIEFRNLIFFYTKEVPVLKCITLSIQKGSVTAIVGETGSGKSTLIQLILRFYEHSQSSIFIDGVDIKEFTLKSLRAHIALVSQETILFNDTLRNNIIYGMDRDISEGELMEVLVKARLHDFVKSLPDGLETYVGDRGMNLSGGEKQRLSIARAFLKGSEILILDEATSSLDTHTERYIKEAVDEILKNKTVIIIAHRLSTIKNADKVVVMEKGRIIEENTLDALIDEKGKFYEYWEAQKV